jgi:hypothetical protein
MRELEHENKRTFAQWPCFDIVRLGRQSSSYHLHSQRNKVAFFLWGKKRSASLQKHDNVK